MIQITNRWLAMCLVVLTSALAGGCGGGNTSSNSTSTTSTSTTGGGQNTGGNTTAPSVGCSALSDGKATPVKVAITWGTRSSVSTSIQKSAKKSRDAISPSSALSAIATLKDGNADGTDFTFTINRDATNLAGYTQTYTSANSAIDGCRLLTITFYALPNGTGDVVGAASNTVGILSDGTGMGDISTIGTIQSVTIPFGQSVTPGQTSQLVVTALGAQNLANNFQPPVIAITPGSVFWTLNTGGNYMSLTAGGMATGKATGIGRVTAAVDGISSNPSNSVDGRTAVAVGSTGAVVIDPPAVTLNPSDQYQFSAFVVGSTTQPNFSIQEAPAGGSIISGSTNLTGEYTAPTISGTYHVVATNPNSAAQKSVSTVTVVGGSVSGHITLSPATVTINAGEQIGLTANVVGDASPSVSFAIEEGAAGGTLIPAANNGPFTLYTAPTQSGTYHVMATNQHMSADQDVATITVVNGVKAGTILGVPTTLTMYENSQIGIQPTVVGATTPRLSWALQEASGGILNASNQVFVTYEAPATANTYHVLVTNLDSPANTITVTIKVVAATGHELVLTTPIAATIQANEQLNVVGMIPGQPQIAVGFSVINAPGSIANGVAFGTLSGEYEAPSNAGVFTCVAAELSNTSIAANITITVLPLVTLGPPGTVVISPSSISLRVGEAVSFESSIVGGANDSISYSIAEAGGGSLSSNRYTATKPGVFHIVATDTQTGKTSTSTVTVTGAPAINGVITVSPVQITVFRGDTVSFQLAVANDSTPDVSAAVQEGSAGGTVTSVSQGGGLQPTFSYIAPDASGTFHVVFTNQKDTSKQTVVPVTVQ